MTANSSPEERVGVYRPELKKIDVLNSEAFHASLVEAMRSRSGLVLDLSEVQFIDSSGLGKIIAALRNYRAGGGEMRICGVQPPVQVLFTMVRLGEIVGIDKDAAASSATLLQSSPGASTAR